MEDFIFFIGTLYVQTVDFNNKQHMWTQFIWLGPEIIVGSFEHSNKPRSYGQFSNNCALSSRKTLL